MANILANGGNGWWTSLQGVTPPPSWNAEAGWFEWFGYFGVGGPAQGMTYTGDVADIPLSMNILMVTGTNIYSVPTVIRFDYTGAGTFQEFDLDPSDSYSTTLNIPLAATGIAVSISSAGGDYTYSMDITLTGLSAVDRPVETTPCAELGRVTRAYVSGYARDRVHVSRLYRYEKRCLVANFNGAIPAARTIASATWQTTNYSGSVMSDAVITGRETSITIATQMAGSANIKCSVTLDNGEIYTQLFRLDVQGAPYYMGDTQVTGPASVIVTA